MPACQSVPVNQLIVLTTMPDEASAEQLAKALIERSLAACVNILPRMKSIYRWKDRLEQGTEHQLLIKTLSEKYEDVENFIKNAHPYELPEILAIPVEKGLPGYLGWIADNCENNNETDC